MLSFNIELFCANELTVPLMSALMGVPLKNTGRQKTIHYLHTTIAVKSSDSNRLMAQSSDFNNATLILCVIRRFKSIERPKSYLVNIILCVVIEVQCIYRNLMQ